MIAKMNPYLIMVQQMKTHLMSTAKLKLITTAKMKKHLMIAKILRLKAEGYIIHPLKLKRKNSIFNVLIKDYLNVINLMFNI